MKPDKVPQQRAARKDDQHDIIFFRKAGGGQRFPFDTKLGRNGGPEDLPLKKGGGRKARELARPDAGNCGPALAISPTRPEPASQNGTCVIVNQENVKIRNTWTTARLNNEPNNVKDPYDRPLEPLPDEFAVVVAWSDGEVSLLTKPNGRGQPVRVDSINLSQQGELWYQLRNGLVAGRVPIHQASGDTRIVPTVCVASLEEDHDDEPLQVAE